MIGLAALTFAGRDWIWPAVFALAAAAVAIAWSYRRTSAPTALRAICAALKAIGVVALLACLLEPMWTRHRVKPGANILAVVADNSQSMTLRDRDAATSRGDALRAAVAPPTALWRTELTKDFEVKNFLADVRLQPTENFAELTFSGQGSALRQALSQIAEQNRGQNLAGVVLLTDGVATDLGDLTNLEGLPPVYPVVFGKDGPPRDLAVTQTAVTQTSFEDAPVTVQSEVLARGFPGEEIVGQLFEYDPVKQTVAEKPAVEQTLKVPANSEKLVYRFQLRPAHTGVLFYRLAFTPKQRTPEEATLANNETVVTINRGAGPHRVLYVSGRPNWEYKFLQRALQGDDQTRLVSLIRIAKREPKFEFRGRSGESSNPLFRGFGNQSKEDIERYDQPVFVRLNMDDEIELRGGFPKAPEELFKYRAIILDDLESEFFNADQMSLLQRYVSERGGGVLMLGGMESFRDGKFARTAVGDMLPVYLDGNPRAATDGKWHLNLTREGWLQPWARLRNNEAEEKKRLQTQPSFDVLNLTGNPKPAATVVATVSDGTQELPALVTQRFGRGRTAALLLGDLWHSGLGEEALENDLLKGWRQMIRWLIADVPEPVDIRLEPRTDGQGMQVQVTVRDQKFDALDNATVTLKVTHAGAPAGTPPITLTADASTNESGMYEATFVPREAGGYRVEATVTNDANAVVGAAANGWTSDLVAAEFRDLKPNLELMEQLAQKTGGKVLQPAQLDSFARDLPLQKAPVTELSTLPLWHTPFMFLFALGCFVAEWGIRRWRGLP